MRGPGVDRKYALHFSKLEQKYPKISQKGSSIRNLIFLFDFTKHQFQFCHDNQRGQLRITNKCS